MATGNMSASDYMNQIVPEVVLNPRANTGMLNANPSKLEYVKKIVMRLFRWLINP